MFLACLKPSSDHIHEYFETKSGHPESLAKGLHVEGLNMNSFNFVL